MPKFMSHQVSPIQIGQRCLDHKSSVGSQCRMATEHMTLTAWCIRKFLLSSQSLVFHFLILIFLSLLCCPSSLLQVSPYDEAELS